MNEDTSAAARRPSPSKMSKTPSWVTLGFVLGALFVWSLPERERKAPPPPAPATKFVSVRLPRTTEIEAAFALWGRYAVWDLDRTEVALWNDEAKSYADFFEVVRVDDNYYFRSIPKLTRPILRNTQRTESPLVFTELRGSPPSVRPPEPVDPTTLPATPAVQVDVPRPSSAPPPPPEPPGNPANK